MSSTISQLQDIATKAGELVETKAEILKLQLAGKTSETLSSVISLIAIVSMFGVALTIISIGLAFWLGLILGKIYYGFFIVGGFYAVMGVLLVVFREKLVKRPLSNLIIDKIID